MKRQRIAITGAGGRLGAALVRVFSSEHDVFALKRPELDLNHPESLPSLLRGEPFDCLINCAALTNVDYCETHEEEAFRVNAESVEVLAALCTERGARCIHFSTDYVFEGDTPGLRGEEDPADPVSVYGASKKAGENRLLAVSPEHLALRVSWVFGPERPSFIDMIAARALEQDEVEAIDGKTSSPAFTEDLASLLRPLLFDIPAGGILHLCNQGETTWRSYGAFALECLRQLDVPLKTTTVRGIPIGEMKNFVARRPMHTAMSTARYTALTGIQPRHWHDAVREFCQVTLAPRLQGLTY